MRRVAVASVCSLAALALAVGLFTVGSQPAQARGGAKVLCWNKSFPPPTGHGRPAIERAPRRCTFFRRGKAALAYAVQSLGLRWRSWGGKTAHGRGKALAGAISPVRVTLLRPVRGCGGRVYSKARFRFPRLGNKTRMALWTRCG